MKIKINGESKEVETSISVAELLEDINTPAVGVAVEVNREIIPRSKHGSSKLKEGDRVEIIRMVGGG